MIRAIGSKKDLSVRSMDCDYYEYASDLLENEIVLKMKNFIHHGDTSCYQHCLNVSYYNYLLCRRLGLDVRAGVRGGLLHDLFLYDWHTYVKKPGQRRHGLTHAAEALKNAREHFDISEKEADIISKHMFPVNIAFPRFRETFVIVLTDKYCAIAEVLSYWRRKLFSK